MTLFLAFLVIYGCGLSLWWLVPAAVIWSITAHDQLVALKQLRFLHRIAWGAARERGVKVEQ